MTGYTVHTGSTAKFSGGWDQIFSGKKTPTKKTFKAAKPAKKAAAKKRSKKK